jgi:hypothetical protein
VFTGLGKLRKYQVTVPINKEVNPVAQPLRRLPYHMRAIEKKLDQELLDLDIIARVEGARHWISPIQVVPKKTKYWGLVVDMHQTNVAIARERYSMPTIEGLLNELREGQIFPKLDLTWGYHQIEFHEDSRNITTFCTSTGLYRYKRVMFGLNCAPGLYHKIISQVLQNREGVCNFLDDKVVYGKLQAEHDTRLDKVLQTFREKGLTLNRKKCQLGVEKIDFLCHIISSQGIRPSESNVQAIMEFRAPQNIAAVRSF